METKSVQQQTHVACACSYFTLSITDTVIVFTQYQIDGGLTHQAPGNNNNSRWALRDVVE